MYDVGAKKELRENCACPGSLLNQHHKIILGQNRLVQTYSTQYSYNKKAHNLSVMGVSDLRISDNLIP